MAACSERGCSRPALHDGLCGECWTADRLGPDYAMVRGRVDLADDVAPRTPKRSRGGLVVHGEETDVTASPGWKTAEAEALDALRRLRELDERVEGLVREHRGWPSWFVATWWVQGEPRWRPLPDPVDRAIIDAADGIGYLAVRRIASDVNLAPSNVSRRVSRLVEDAPVLGAAARVVLARLPKRAGWIVDPFDAVERMERACAALGRLYAHKARHLLGDVPEIVLWGCPIETVFEGRPVCIFPLWPDRKRDPEVWELFALQDAIQAARSAVGTFRAMCGGPFVIFPDGKLYKAASPPRCAECGEPMLRVTRRDKRRHDRCATRVRVRRHRRSASRA